MEIKLIRLYSFLNENKEQLLKEDEDFIADLNDELIDDDIILSFDSKNPVFNIAFIESGGSETKFLEVLDELSRPILLLNTSKNNSLAATFEIGTYLDKKNEQYLMLTGLDPKVGILPILRHISPIINSANDMNNKNLGVIGKPSDWLISSVVDYKVVKEKFGINLLDIPIEELCEEIDKDQLLDYIPHLETLKKKFTNEKVLHDALSIYSAIKRLVTKYDLEGLTIRCFDLLGKYKNTSCLAFALLNEEGIVSACEGDIPSLLTMYFIKKLNGQPSFQANPSMIDFKNKTLVLAHCTVPLNMVNKYELMTHFESNLGIGVKGELNKGTVTILKLFPDLSHDLFLETKILENLSLPNYCRTQIKVELNDEKFYSILRSNFGNHVIITYDDISEQFPALIEIFNARYKSKKHIKEE